MTVIPETGTPGNLPSEILDSPVVLISDNDAPLTTSVGPTINDGLKPVPTENNKIIMWSPWILLLLIFVICGFFLILAKRRREEEEEEEAY